MVIVEWIFLIVDRYRNMFPGKDFSSPQSEIVSAFRLSSLRSSSLKDTAQSFHDCAYL
jgi:hypothetical protein